MFLFPPRYVCVPLRDSVLNSRAEWLCFLDVPFRRHASNIATRLRSVAPGSGGLWGASFCGGLLPPPSHTYFASVGVVVGCLIYTANRIAGAGRWLLPFGLRFR